MAIDVADWDRAIDLLNGLGLTPINTKTIGDLAQALEDARARGYAQAARDSRAICSRAGGCLP